MPKLSYIDVLNKLKKKDFDPIYFFYGSESYFIDQLIAEIEQNALPEEQKSFNQTVLYGKDIGKEPGKLIDLAMRLPMMAERQVVIVKEAQNISGWDQLISYVKQPNNTTILAFAYKDKTFDRRTKFGKLISKQAVVVESKEYKDYQMSTWIKSYLQQKGYEIDDKSSQLLIEFLGTDLQKVANEIEKLLLVMDTKTITPNEIEENIGISKDFNVYELQNAFLFKDAKKVFQILNYFKQNPKAAHITYIISTIYFTFSKLFILTTGNNHKELSKIANINSYYLKDYQRALNHYSVAKIKENIHLLHEYDLRSKGMNNRNIAASELLRELAFKLLAK